MSRLSYFALPLLILITGAFVFSWKGNKNEERDLRRLGDHLTTIEVQAPSFLDFAGEAFPLEKWELRSRLEKQMRYQLNAPEGLKLLMKRASRYEYRFRTILKEEGVPEDFFYLALAESNLSNVVSPAGASGFWQLMPVAARHYGLEVSSTVDERYHPEKSTRAAARYLRDAHKELGDWTLVAAAYNMGTGGINKAIGRQGNSDFYSLALNKETGHYVYKVLGFKCLMETPERYGIAFSSIRDGYQPLRYKTVKVTESIADLGKFAKNQGVSLTELRTINPWLIANRLEVKAGKTYEIRIALSLGVPAEELLVKGHSVPDSVLIASTPRETLKKPNA